MRLRRSIRLAAPALAMSALAVAFLIPGSAATATSGPKAVKGMCAHMGGLVAGTVTVSGCSPSPEASATGIFSGFGQNLSGSATLTFTNGAVVHFHYTSSIPISQTTTSKTGATISNKKYKCPKYADGEGLQSKVSGTITSQTKAAGTGGFKGKMKTFDCVDFNTLTGVPISLLSGKPMKF